MKIKLLLSLILLTSFSSYASSCKIVEVRKVKSLHQQRSYKSIPVNKLDECIEEAKLLLGRKSSENFSYRVRTGKNHRISRRVLNNAQLKTVKVIMRFKGYETAGQTVVAKFKLDS